MSALGHKQTCAAQNVMSALPPIATAKADIRKRSCLLYPQKRTCAVQDQMSAKGHKRTWPRSFYHLVRGQEDAGRNVYAKRPGGLETNATKTSFCDPPHTRHSPLRLVCKRANSRAGEKYDNTYRTGISEDITGRSAQIR